MTAGKWLTGIGAGLLVPAVVLAATSHNGPCWFGRCASESNAVYSAPFWVLSVASLSVGIPLWAVNARRPPVQATSAERFVPEVTVGAARMTLQWTF
jgi:hypothetical protein